MPTPNPKASRVVLITGAASGIGAAAAARFAQAGERLVLFDRDAEALHAVAAPWGDRACAVVGDASDRGDVDRLFDLAMTRFGRIDVAFLNAGIPSAIAPLGEADTDEFDRVMAINVRGVFLALNRAMPLMKQLGGGSVIVTSSTAGLRGAAGMAAYVTSKHAVIGLMRTAALEGAARRVRVNAINPGPIQTPMVRDIEQRANPADPSSVHQMFIDTTPMRRFGQPEEVAALVAFLASDEAAYCTGGTYSIDGGIMAGRA